MALKAKVTKVSRNAGSPQVDVEVKFFDDEDTKISYNRVLTYGEIGLLSIEAVNKEIQRIGQEYKQTVEKEDVIKNEFEGKEFDID